MEKGAKILYIGNGDRNMSVSLSLDFDQLKNLIDQLSFVEKAKLARYLDDQTLMEEFKAFRASMKDIPLTFDEITQEVEEVREEMYREGRHRL